MLEEYDYYISLDERELQHSAWGGSDHRQQQMQWHNSTNPMGVNGTSTWTVSMVSRAYLETIMVFLLAILLYFAFICCTRWDRREMTKRDVDKSVITRVSDGKRELVLKFHACVVVFISYPSIFHHSSQRVLAHGQSQDFHSPITEVGGSKNNCCSKCFIVRCIFKREKRKKIHPHHPAESASEILEVYRTMSNTPTSNKPQLLCAQCDLESSREVSDDCPQAKTDDDTGGSIDIALAEEGLGGLGTNQLTCPICIEPFRVEEQVTWSKIGQCRHVFHYDCILPWAVLGNYECPVCRAHFWSEQPRRCCLPPRKLEADRKESRFCVRHGLVSP